MMFRLMDPDSHKKLELPSRATKNSAGYDLQSAINCEIPSGGRMLVDTGVGWFRNNGVNDQPYVGLIKPRSGLAVRHGIDTLAGVIDNDYMGEIKVLLINHGDKPFVIRMGDRIAQLVVQLFYTVSDETIVTLDRDDGGFGSTGK